MSEIQTESIETPSKSHLKRNLIILLIVLFLLPGIPEFISTYSFTTWITASFAYWQQIATLLTDLRQ